MKVRFILTSYVEKALKQAIYDKLEDGSYAGRIPPCSGVLAFAPDLRSCEEELRSTLEDWLLTGLRLGHPLPVLSGRLCRTGPRHPGWPEPYVWERSPDRDSSTLKGVILSTHRHLEMAPTDGEEPSMNNCFAALW